MMNATNENDSSGDEAAKVTPRYILHALLEVAGMAEIIVSRRDEAGGPQMALEASDREYMCAGLELLQRIPVPLRLMGLRNPGVDMAKFYLQEEWKIVERLERMAKFEEVIGVPWVKRKDGEGPTCIGGLVVELVREFHWSANRSREMGNVEGEISATAAAWRLHEAFTEFFQGMRERHAVAEAGPGPGMKAHGAVPAAEYERVLKVCAEMRHSLRGEGWSEELLDKAFGDAGKAVVQVASDAGTKASAAPCEDEAPPAASVATDTERLDWLESRNDPQLYCDYESGLWGVAEYQGNVNDRVLVWLSDKTHETLSGAIDAAMARHPRKG